MPFRHVTGEFDNNALRAMREAYDRACVELGISLDDADKLRRELVASIIIEIAHSGVLDPGVLQRRAVLRLLNSA